MAKTRTITRYVTPRSAPRAPAPIVVRTSAPRAKHHKGGRRRHGQSATKTLMGIIVGGLALGYVDKSGTALPTIPVLGKAGTIAVACHFIGKGRQGLVTDVRNAAAAVAAWQFGNTGKVAGSVLGEDGDEGSILATQT